MQHFQITEFAMITEKHSSEIFSMTQTEPVWPLYKKEVSPHRVTINLTKAEHIALVKLAFRCKASRSRVGKFAINQLVGASHDALPLLPEVDDPAAAVAGADAADSRRLTVNLTEAELAALMKLAVRAEASAAQLGKLAVKLLLVNSEVKLKLTRFCGHPRGFIGNVFHGQDTGGVFGGGAAAGFRMNDAVAMLTPASPPPRDKLAT